MLSLLLSARYVIGDFFMEYLQMIYLPDEDKIISFTPKIVDGTFSESIRIFSASFISKMFIWTGIIILFLALIHIPIPNNICDRVKLQTLELLLRLSNEYLGNLVENLSGPKVRNIFTRFWLALPFYIFSTKYPDWLKIETIYIAGVKCRTYIPSKNYKKTDGAIIYIHGGGFCSLSPKCFDSMLINLITNLGCFVISIDYDWAPEYVYPRQVNQIEDVVTEFCESSYANFDIDPTSIIIMGDSAGGNLSTVTTQRCKRKGKNYFKAQVLIYPVTSTLDFSTPSFQQYYNEYPNTAILNPFILTRWYLLYLGIPATSTNIKKCLNNQHLEEDFINDINIKESLNHDHLPSIFTNPDIYKKPVNNIKPCPELAPLYTKFAKSSDFCPIIAEDMENLPEALIITCGYDILRDEGILYAKKLSRKGVPVDWKHYPLAYHGIMNMPYSEQRTQIIEDIKKFYGIKGFNIWQRLFTNFLFSIPLRKPKWLIIKNIKIGNINCRLYIPKNNKRKYDGCIIFAHGGGWCIMKTHFCDFSLYNIIKNLGTILISVDYSLSPEKRFGTAIDEIEKVVTTIYDNYYKELNINRNKISLMGESAGGNLCLAVALRLSKFSDKIPIKCLILPYPVTGVFHFLLPSYQYYNDNFKNSGMLSPDNMARWILLYLGLDDIKNGVEIIKQNGHISKKIRENPIFKESFNAKKLINFVENVKYIENSNNFSPPDLELANKMEKYLLNSEFSPLMCCKEKLSFLPPTFILTSNYDILRDEGILFNNKLKDAGVSVKLKNYKNSIHGSMTIPLSVVANEMSKDIVNFIQNIS
ncbi:Alpha/beta hydrolase fold-3 domain-containing protein [Strongyloides ratti]|uniref:Alpha/beta hydrolase fold-3 domain-containing protein n=1 Tax=Strongyloides ratti TaxID=34506 RepID=A0A090L135_STRRB|nr:Alpha/beta hydrolase fold-3 domain-containing protein [Strongyloides ratti]CEF61817.1 Alpha/beta hydrolase fold-3 domain-containing protein [Strongyloides ratti]